MVDFSFLVHRQILLTTVTYNSFCQFKFWQQKDVFYLLLFLLIDCMMLSQTSYLRLGCVRCHVWVSKVMGMCTCAICVPWFPRIWLLEAGIVAFSWQEISTEPSLSPEASGIKPKGTVTEAVLSCHISLHLQLIEVWLLLSQSDLRTHCH